MTITICIYIEEKDKKTFYIRIELDYIASNEWCNWEMEIKKKKKCWVLYCLQILKHLSLQNPNQDQAR